MSAHFLGVHVGRTSLRASLLAKEGTPAHSLERRFREPRELPEALIGALRELSGHPAWGELKGAAIGLDKGLRCALPVAELQRLLPEGLPLVTLPAHLVPSFWAPSLTDPRCWSAWGPSCVWGPWTPPTPTASSDCRRAAAPGGRRSCLDWLSIAPS